MNYIIEFTKHGIIHYYYYYLLLETLEKIYGHIVSYISIHKYIYIYIVQYYFLFNKLLFTM